MKSARQPRRPPAVYQMSHAVLGPLLKALGISCKDAYELCSWQMDRELTTGESFRMRFHLMICAICRQLPTQFKGLRELVRACEQDHTHEESLHTQLPAEVKERIVERLKGDVRP
ncbi:MAG: zf-HC2 domain-containing protein [Luteolibacter sp.]